MIRKQILKQKTIQQSNLSSIKEKERLLKRYAGIFKDDIEGYAKKIAQKVKAQKDLTV